MGPPKARSLILLALLLCAAIAAFYSSSIAVDGHHASRRNLQSAPRPAPIADFVQQPPEPAILYGTPEPTTTAITTSTRSRRTITMSCAKAGPHWNKNLPKFDTTAVELSPYPFSDAAESSTPPSRRRRLEAFPQSSITLHNGTHIASAAATNLKYLLSIQPDDLLYAWRRNAGLSQPANARPLRGWESPGSELRGHVLGHWLSAASLCYASTRNPRIKARIDGVLAALSECEASLGGTGWLAAFPESFLERVEQLIPVWAPYYTTHKLLQGLLDVHEIIGGSEPLRLALKLARYIQRRISSLLTKTSIEHHWTTLNKEFGGLNDVLWKLHQHQQRSAAAAGSRKMQADDALAVAPEGLQLRALASHFDRPCLLGPLAAQEDQLTQMHANTQLPVLQGAHSRYEATGDSDFRQLAAFFVTLLLRTRSFATGGSSIGEYWPAANRLGDLVKMGEGTTQESCSTHNMMRLVRGLLLTSIDDAEAATHAEYHERALWNSVLGTQRGDKPGEMLYWLPLGSGVSKMDLKHPQHGDGQQHGWSIPHGDFWCCVGSGIEAFSRLGDSTFFQLAEEAKAEDDDDDGGDGGGRRTLYVMQLISSTLSWQAAGLSAKLVVDEPGSKPADQPLKLSLSIIPGTSDSKQKPAGERVRCRVRLRLPSWAATDGKPPVASIDSPYQGTNKLPSPASSSPILEVDRAWRKGEALQLSLPMNLRIEPLADTRPQFAHLKAILAGPLLLAGLTPGPRTIIVHDANLPVDKWLEPVPASASTQLRSLLSVPDTPKGASGYISAGTRGLSHVAGPLPSKTAHDASAATWRVNCVPHPHTCAKSTAFALEHFEQPGAFLSLGNATTATTLPLRLLQMGAGEQPPDSSLFVPIRDGVEEAEKAMASAALGKGVSLAPRSKPDARLCVDKSSGQLFVLLGDPSGTTTFLCRFRLAPPAASYSPLSMWYRPQRASGSSGSAPLPGRGFLFLPLKDIVDQVYSVYFHIVSDASQAPLECSPYREKWADEEADTPLMPAASRDLARKLVATKSAKWAHVKGLEFRAQGELKTPWGHGKWGVLIDKPGVAFADFGGAMHEITFERWPVFISTRCGDGEVVRGSMDV